MSAYVLTFLLCLGGRCELVELPMETLQACMIQAQPVAAAMVRQLDDKGIVARVERIRCTTERRA